MSTTAPQGPPYAPQIASLGGQPTPIPDVVICSILIAIYAGSAAGHMSIYQLNRRKTHHFFISAALFGFSMARIVTCSLRIAVAYHPSNVSLNIAAQILLSAGVLIVYVVNLVFAQRILRARQPEIGWHTVLRVFFRILYGLVGLALVLVITFIVIQFYTLDSELREACRDIQLVAMTYLLFVTLVPLVILAITWSLKESPRAEEFGTKDSSGGLDTWSTGQKSLILLTSALLCTLGSAFKTGSNFESPRPKSDPAWYQSKAALYVFTFLIEISILYMFLLTRIDHRFHVPDGSSKRRSFAGVVEATNEGQELPQISAQTSTEAKEAV
ncbi:uncharacterized protein MYCFIDRAFT_82707 [Pseudocercospora fijiensis CIRAD86]|uniref:Uncharacterized protein n=1 Tax=Pseudocercospora fijiensis (strain CIRAD86) TaxID=383855 RepID=M3A376_PSEFD|nr:uncharacterized protein MYCFIDRAFT_82707 [Pseudocercospora fijiensis CIRAD86]EME85549.1 hypothetical protein MYCFIDRAFT_82707 [Pseudocercospora fijiensis CIRAD86]